MKLKQYIGRHRTNLVTYGVVILGFVIMQVLSASHMLSSSVEGFLVPICAYVVLAVSLNLVVGISGELSLGHAGFMGVGAFTGIIVAALLKDGRAHVTGLHSEKSGKPYDATVVLEDTGQYVNFKLDFDRQKGGGK